MKCTLKQMESLCNKSQQIQAKLNDIIMKAIFKVAEVSEATNAALLGARIGIAALMLTHGIPKLVMLFSGQPMQFPPVFGMSPELSLALAVVAEVLCSIFILIGLGTRLAVIPLAITMIIAAFVVHENDPLSVKESALQYLLVYVVLFVTGSGKFSVDHLLRDRLETKPENGIIVGPLAA